MTMNNASGDSATVFNNNQQSGSGSEIGSEFNQNVNNSNQKNDSQEQQATSSSEPKAATAAATTFVPLTRARMRENLDAQEVIDINNIEETHDCHDAAKKARLSSFKLSENEFLVFHDLIGDDKVISNAYIYIRDRILQLWFLNVQVELKKRKAYESLEDHELESIPVDLKEKLFSRCFDYLERTGYINFGILDITNQSKEDGEEHPKLTDRSKRAAFMTSHLYKPPLKQAGPKRTGRVIILGAGLSGLMAARQLQKFGMEVIVLEARNRVGGRVHTYRKGNFIADLGPTSLNGIVGNPVVVLGKQLELMVMELRQKIPIYENKIDKNGASVCHQVDTMLERAVEREYNKIMEGTRVMKNNYKIEKYQGKPFPVGLAVDWVMKLQEKNIKDEQISHLKDIEDLYQELIECINNRLSKTKIIKDLHNQLVSDFGSKGDPNFGKVTNNSNSHTDKNVISTFHRRSLVRDLDLAIKEHKILVKREKELKAKIDDLTTNPPSDTYLSLRDRRLLDWHFAELEYALGCPISELGIHYEDDEEIFDGSHWMLVHGFNTIVEAMKTDLDIHLGTAVKKITIMKNGCKVLTYQPDHPQNDYVEFTADAILCTLPLGVMKESIIASRQAAVLAENFKNQNSSEPPEIRNKVKGKVPLVFQPCLPKWKTKSLNKLGCGNLNKIILSFDKVFWSSSLHLFGVVDHKAIARGEFFLFWHHGRTPTLTGLISGEAADKIESFSDVEILERCLNVLRSIYGVSNVPAPKDYIVTKWRKDPWALGAWSYLQTGASGDDYEACAEPVILDATKESPVFKETRPTVVGAPTAGAATATTPQTPTQDNTNGQTKRALVSRIKSADEIPRLFFAGEHTTRYHFASAHGAVLTGLREAARIANIYLGCPYDDEDEPGIFAY